MLERSTRLVLLAAASAALALALALPAPASGRDVSIDGPGDGEGCASFRARFDGSAGVTEAQTLTVPGGTPLRLHAPAASGLRVSGWDRADFEVTACKAARDAATLARISVSAPGGVVAVDGADGDDAAVFFQVKAPKGALLDLAAENGPVSLRDVAATVRARLENGPLSLASVHGDVEADVVNGPVSVRDGSGSWTLKLTNGPLTARLSGPGWEGKGLVAETINGPLTVRLDPRFASPLRITAAGHAPFRCRATACAGGHLAGAGHEDGEQTFEAGTGEPVVRFSTTNGPVTILDDGPAGR